MEEIQYSWYCSCSCEYFEVSYISGAMSIVCAECSRVIPLSVVLQNAPTFINPPKVVTPKRKPAVDPSGEHYLLTLDKKSIMVSVDGKIFIREL